MITIILYFAKFVRNRVIVFKSRLYIENAQLKHFHILLDDRKRPHLGFLFEPRCKRSFNSAPLKRLFDPTKNVNHLWYKSNQNHTRLMISIDTVTRNYQKHLDTLAQIMLRLANMAVGAWLFYYQFIQIFTPSGINYSLSFQFARKIFFLVVGLLLVASDLQPVHFVRDELSFLSYLILIDRIMGELVCIFWWWRKEHA